MISLTLLFIAYIPLSFDMSVSSTVYSVSCLGLHRLLNGLLQYTFAGTSATKEKNKGIATSLKARVTAEVLGKTKHGLVYSPLGIIEAHNSKHQILKSVYNNG